MAKKTKLVTFPKEPCMNDGRRCVVCGSLKANWDLQYALKEQKSNGPYRETISELIKDTANQVKLIQEYDLMKSDWILQQNMIKEIHDRLYDLNNIIENVIKPRANMVESLEGKDHA